MAGLLTASTGVIAIANDARAERWLPVRGLESLYEVSDQGRVRSLRSGQVLQPARDIHGRHRVSLYRADRIREQWLVHRLVLFAFIGPPPAGYEACHGPGGSSDHRLINLRWDTSSANKFDTVRDGHHHAANRSHCPRRHLLAAPNLVPSHGGRKCLACSRAQGYIQNARRYGRPTPDLQQLSDQYYAQLMDAAIDAATRARVCNT